ncbi:MAG: TonB-dependent receptor plug domain-containing protein, partial [Crocinitomicaceae bacterium]
MKYFFISFLVIISNDLFSQKGIVSGFVKDDSNQPIQGASVIYRKDITIGSTTDEKGFYQLEIPTGSTRLICRYTGMKTDTIAIELYENQTLEINFNLQPFVVNQKQVEIKVGKFDKPIEEQTVTMVVLKPELIENKNTRSIETALDQTPGLNILDGEPQIRGGSGFTFGVGSKVAVIVDDMPMLSGDAGRPEWGFIPVENISQVEVIKGAASVLSGSSALSGSVH